MGSWRIHKGYHRRKDFTSTEEDSTPPLQEPLLLQTREHFQLPNPSSARPFRAKAQQVFPKALFPVKGFSSLCLAVTVSYRLLNYLLTYLLLWKFYKGLRTSRNKVKETSHKQILLECLDLMVAFFAFVPFTQFRSRPHKQNILSYWNKHTSLDLPRILSSQAWNSLTWCISSPALTMRKSFPPHHCKSDSNRCQSFRLGGRVPVPDGTGNMVTHGN